MFLHITSPFDLFFVAILDHYILECNERELENYFSVCIKPTDLHTVVGLNRIEFYKCKLFLCIMQNLPRIFFKHHDILHSN